MCALKPISQASITGALAKAQRYRLLNEPNEAESICRDILEVEPDNRQALISLTLALTDQIPQDAGAFANALGTIARLETPTTARTTPASPGSAGPRHTFMDLPQGLTATPTNGSCRHCGCLRKPNASALQVTTTRFSVGTPRFASSPVTKNSCRWPRRLP